MEKTYPLVLQSLALVDARTDFLDSVKSRLRAYSLAYWLPRLSKILECQEQIAGLCSTAGVPYVFLRGPRFGKRYYERLELRACDDLDLLIPVSTWRDCEQHLLTNGFGYVESEQVRCARADIMGQTELIHEALSVRVDLNWRLTANLGIGNVSPPMEAFWERMISVGRGEYALHPEDELLELIRHIGQGHDFEHGVLRTCADVAALLGKCRDQLDMAVVAERAAKLEASQILRIFASFYSDMYMRNSNRIPPMEDGSLGLSRARRLECHLFIKAIIYPLIRLKSRRSTAFGEYLVISFCLVSKLWALDRVTRVAIVFRWLIWPSKRVLILLTRNFAQKNTALLRIHRIMQAILISPSLFAGSSLRILTSLLRNSFGRTLV